jgi:hypothetical protein
LDVGNNGTLKKLKIFVLLYSFDSSKHSNKKLNHSRLLRSCNNKKILYCLNEYIDKWWQLGWFRKYKHLKSGIELFQQWIIKRVIII